MIKIIFALGIGTTITAALIGLSDNYTIPGITIAAVIGIIHTYCVLKS